MGVIRETTSDGVSGMEWMATAAFLGALYCTVLGVFKRFRVSVNFNLGAREPTTMEVVSKAVYRPIKDSFNDNFTNEVTNTSKTYPSVKREEQPKNIKTIPTVKLHESNTNNVQQSLGVNAVSNGPDTAHASSSKTIDKTKSGSKTNLKSDEKVKKKEKVGVNVENTETIDKEKAKKENKLKKEKEEKLLKEKLKKEKDKKLKAKEGKESKEKKTKGKAPSKPAASITINEEAAASTQAAARNPMSSFQGTPKNPVVRDGQSLPSYEEDIFSKNAKNLLGNPKSVQIPIQEIGEPKGFASSWDQVAQHRQNMQRELKSISAPATNLRAMANQETNNKKEINNLFLTSSSSPRNNNPPPQANMNRRFSDFSSGQESDTEA